MGDGERLGVKQQARGHRQRLRRGLGLSVVGALVASTVNVKFGITMSYGEVVQPVNDLLDSIIPHFGNVVTVALIYWGLGRKNMTSGKMIVLVLVAAILLSAIGVLA